MTNLWTFDIASGIAIFFAGWTIFLQKKELALQREELALQRKEMKGQREETRRLADLTAQTAKATRLQSEIEFCKKIELKIIALFSRICHVSLPLDIFMNIAINLKEVKIENSKNNEQKFFKFDDKEFYSNGKDTILYISLYKQIRNYLKEDSQLYEYYLGENSPFTILYEKCSELMK